MDITTAFPDAVYLQIVPMGQISSTSMPYPVQLVPQSSVDLDTVGVTVLDIHSPEAEAVHDLTERVVVVIEFN